MTTARYRHAYDQAIEIEPKSTLAHARRGNALSALDRKDEATKAFERAAEIRQQAK